MLLLASPGESFALRLEALANCQSVDPVGFVDRLLAGDKVLEFVTGADLGLEGVSAAAVVSGCLCRLCWLLLSSSVLGITVVLGRSSLSWLSLAQWR
jgi:hypothetical protein